MDEVGALEVFPRPVISERGHPCRDERGKTRVERGAIQPQGFVERAAARVEQDVGPVEQASQVLAPTGVAWPILQIEHH